MNKTERSLWERVKKSDQKVTEKILWVYWVICEKGILIIDIWARI